MRGSSTLKTGNGNTMTLSRGELRSQEAKQFPAQSPWSTEKQELTMGWCSWEQWAHELPTHSPCTPGGSERQLQVDGWPGGELQVWVHWLREQRKENSAKRPRENRQKKTLQRAYKKTGEEKNTTGKGMGGGRAVGSERSSSARTQTTSPGHNEVLPMVITSLSSMFSRAHF